MGNEPALRALDWQPIETAPKDGRFVLIAFDCPNPEYKAVCVARIRKGWSTWDSFPGDYTKHPTHWMPLPPPPQAPAGCGSTNCKDE